MSEKVKNAMEYFGMTEPAEVISLEDVESKCSRYGNTFTEIDNSAISALKEGKILFIDDGEYGHFIRFAE